MSTTQETPIIDYWAIFNELMKTQEPVRKAENLHRLAGMTPSAVLRESSVIGFKAPRQWGKTWFVIDLLKEHPDSVVIVSNLTWQTQLLESRDLSTGEYRLPDALHGQVITALQFLHPVEDIADKIRQAPFIIVDESVVVYHRIRRQSVLTILGEYARTDVTVVEIN